MKKTLLILFFGFFVLANAFTLPEFKISAGFGLYSTGDFGGGYEYSYSDWESSGTGYNKNPYFGGGIFVFYDMTYVEINLGFFVAGGEWIHRSDGVHDYNLNVGLAGIDIGSSLKYPFEISSRFSIFPLTTINYRALGNDDHSALWFKFGGGLDISITNRAFFRGNVLYGFRLKNKDETDPYSWLDNRTYTVFPGHGFDVKFAFGFKFW
jgi:hypothetical protein